jgi:hypothetical protein
LAWLSSPAAAALHPVVRAAIFHQRFTAIHPFRDGMRRPAPMLACRGQDLIRVWPLPVQQQRWE